MSTFNPEDFLNQTTNEASTARPPIPPGDYTGLISEITPKPWTSQKTGASGMRFEVKLSVELTPSVQAAVGLNTSQLTLTDSIMLDLTEQGTIDFGAGKNGKLRAYREATGQNTPGQAFSARMLVGQPIRVKVGHEVYQDRPVERVEGVARP